MFSSRRLKTVLLIAALVAVVFQVQEAASDPCDDAIELCNEYWKMTAQICRIFGDDSLTCELVTYDTIVYCAVLLAWNC